MNARLAKTFVFAAFLLVAVSKLLGSGQGDECVHISSRLTGPDTVAIGQHNRMEVWIANDDLLGGMTSGFLITCSTTIVWDWDYGPYRLMREHGRAVGAWDVDGHIVMIGGGVDGVSPDTISYGGAAFHAGLPPAPSELCYSMQFSVPPEVPEYESGLRIEPHVWPGSWSRRQSTRVGNRQSVSGRHGFRLAGPRQARLPCRNDLSWGMVPRLQQATSRSDRQPGIGDCAFPAPSGIPRL
jgi:hypothetical protein